MRRLLLIGIFMSILGHVAYARVGLGVVWGGSAAWNGMRGNYGAGFSLAVGQLDRVKWDMAIRAWGGRNYFNINVDTSWMLYQYNFTSWLGIFIGLGPYFGFQHDRVRVRGSDGKLHDRFGVDIGARLSIGLRFFFARHFEIWLGAVPNVGLLMDFGHKSIGGNRFRVGGGIGGEIGFRFWI